MIRETIAAALLAAHAVSAAQVQEPSQGRIEIAGTAPNACVVRAPTAGSATNASYRFDSNGGRVVIAQLVDSANGQSLAAAMSLTIPVICNGAHLLMVRSANRGLALGGVAGQPNSGPFAASVPYRVESEWGGQTNGFLSNAAGALEGLFYSARAGQMSLSISIPAGGQPLIAGTYSDEIVLEFQAAN
jgi:hypothetical protein